jgi:L-malate glycosyltransferase
MTSNIGKINIMHTVLSLEVGGLEKIVSDTVSRLDREQFNVEVCCFDTIGELADSLKLNNITVNLLPRSQERYDYFFPFRLCSFLRNKNIHLLHMHSGTFFLGTQAGILARTPAMVYTDHGRHLVDPKILIYMDRFSAFFANRIIAVSKELEEYLINVVSLPHEKTTTIINGIDTDKYKFREKSPALMKEFGISLYTKVVGTVGRLAEVKDQANMINAFSLVIQNFPESILILVGDGPMRNSLQQLVNNIGLSDHVLFVGTRNDVPDILNLLDVFMLTSLSEGTSISLLEAMSSGIAPIVTKVGGNPSLVDHNVNGIVVSPKKVDELAENLFSLLEDSERRKKYGENAAQKVREKFSLATMVNEYERLYISLLNGKLKTPYQLVHHSG